MSGAPCEGLLGLAERDLLRRLGHPTTRHVVRGDVWLVFASPGLSLRIRCSGAAGARVASWTAGFEPGHRLLSDAAGALGLWPAAAPEEDAATVSEPLIRRALPCPDSGRVYSFTATIRGRLITRVSVFDEAPDWL